MLSFNKLERCIGVDAQCVNRPTRLFINMKAATLFGTQRLPGQGNITLMYIHSSCSDMAAVNMTRSDVGKYTETEYGLKER
jgi:hypothetical protein